MNPKIPRNLPPQSTVTGSRISTQLIVTKSRSYICKNVVLFILQVTCRERRRSRAQKWFEYLWNTSFSGPVLKHQTNRHQCYWPWQISSHDVCKELLHPRVCCTVRSASSWWVRHTASTRYCTKGGLAEQAAITPNFPFSFGVVQKSVDMI